MRRLLATAGLLVAAWAFDAHAGSVTLDFGVAQTLTTTAEQDAALQRVVDHANATRPAGQAAWTIETYLIDRFQRAAASWTAAARVAEAAQACETYKTLTAADQQVIKDKLAGRSPCD